MLNVDGWKDTTVRTHQPCTYDNDRAVLEFNIMRVGYYGTAFSCCWRLVLMCWHVDVLGSWHQHQLSQYSSLPVREATINSPQHRPLAPARTLLPKHKHLVQLFLRHVLQPGRASNESALLGSPLPPLLLAPPSSSASPPPPATGATTAHPLPGSHAWRGYSPA